MYSVIWKYTIHPEHEETFEFEYGPYGSWAVLFGESKQYIRTVFHKSYDQENVYIVVDNWRDQEGYEHFMQNNKERYDQMSAGFEYLYSAEEEVGAVVIDD